MYLKEVKYAGNCNSKKMKDKRRQNQFLSFNYDRVFKSIFCSEEVRQKEDFHLLERLISEKN